MERRSFLVRSSLALGAAALGVRPAGGATGSTAGLRVSGLEPAPSGPPDWTWVRSQFDLLDPKIAHFDGFYLVSHPKSVRAAIEKHRAALDLNPSAYMHAMWGNGFERVIAAAAEYMGVADPNEIALTDSTTMGLSILYSGVKIRADQEVLTSTHDHPWATVKALAHRAERDGTKIVTVPLYADSFKATTEEIVANVVKNVTPRTRVVALTWVHSCTGVKMPIRAIADAIAQANQGRTGANRILFCVDGVHGFGIEDVRIPDLGCDFFAAGTHKWIFGPRGTGVVWGRKELWPEIVPLIPAFGRSTDGFAKYTPGGFHTFEHRWALDEGFRFHLGVGKARVQERIHGLNRQLREGLSRMVHVDLRTPVSNDLASGIVCFDVKGKTPGEVISRLEENGVSGSVSPYTPSYARLAASLWNTPEQVDQALRGVAGMG
jgi:selenocysteine lyase/cysteine desulfurase